MAAVEVFGSWLRRLTGRAPPARRAFIEHLISLAGELARGSDPQQRHERVCFHVRSLLECDRSNIFLREGDHYVAHANSGNPDWVEKRFPGHREPADHPLIAEAVRRGGPVLVNDARRDPLMSSEVAERAEINALVVAPILDGRQHPMGFITAEFNQRKLHFRPEEAELFGALARIVALSLEREEADRTEEDLHARLRRADHMAALGRFASTLAHDFNNRLTAIVGISDLLIEESRGTEAEVLLEELVRSVEGAAELTQHLLEVSRGDGQKVGTTDVAAGFRSLGAFLRPLVRSDIDLDVSTALDGSAYASVSELGLRRIASNLVLNAAAASEPANRVRVSLRRLTGESAATASTDADPSPGADSDPDSEPGRDDDAGSLLEITVEDDGAGIPPDELDRIFAPFYTTRPEASGLGLSSVKSAAEAAGGRVELESTVGKGTRVRVILPERYRAPDALETDVKQSPPTQTRIHPTVLIVDDDEPIRRILRHALGRRGIRILEAVNGEDALGLFDREDQEIDVVVTDIVMPQMDGIDLALALSERSRPPRIVFTSAYGPGLRDRLGSRIDDYEFVPKPFTPSQIIEQIELALARSSALH